MWAVRDLRKLVVFSCASILVAGPSAYCAEIVQNIPLVSDPFFATLNSEFVPQLFNPKLGHLSSVVFSLEGTTTPGVFFDIVWPPPTAVMLTTTFALDSTLAGVLENVNQQTGSVSLGPPVPNGPPTFATARGQPFALAENYVFLNPGEFEVQQRPFPIFVTLGVRLYTVPASTPGLINPLTDATFKGSASLIYTYEPVPEPSTLWLPAAITLLAGVRLRPRSTRLT